MRSVTVGSKQLNLSPDLLQSNVETANQPGRVAQLTSHMSNIKFCIGSRTPCSPATGSGPSVVELRIWNLGHEHSLGMVADPPGIHLFIDGVCSDRK